MEAGLIGIFIGWLLTKLLDAFFHTAAYLLKRMKGNFPWCVVRRDELIELKRKSKALEILMAAHAEMESNLDAKPDRKDEVSKWQN